MAKYSYDANALLHGCQWSIVTAGTNDAAKAAYWKFINTSNSLQRSMPPTSIRHIGDTATLLSGSRNAMIEPYQGQLLSSSNPSISGNRVMPFECTSDQLTVFSWQRLRCPKSASSVLEEEDMPG
jgi:hypothetical protein